MAAFRMTSVVQALVCSGLARAVLPHGPLGCKAGHSACCVSLAWDKYPRCWEAGRCVHLSRTAHPPLRLTPAARAALRCPPIPRQAQAVRPLKQAQMAFEYLQRRLTDCQVRRQWGGSALRGCANFLYLQVPKRPRAFGMAAGTSALLELPHNCSTGGSASCSVASQRYEDSVCASVCSSSGCAPRTQSS